MFTHTVQYYNPITDTNETETLRFNLTTPEVADFGLEMDDDIEQQIRDMVEQDDRKRMFSFFKLVMAHAYGRRTPDGKGFAKKQEWLDELFSGFAYEELFIWIFTDPANASKFMNDVLPSKKNMDRVEKANAKNASEPVDTNKDPRKMTREELEAAVAGKMGLANKTPANEA